MNSNSIFCRIKLWMTAMAAVLLVASCQREISFDNGSVPNQQSGTAVYSFGGGTGACTGAVVSGRYNTDTALGTGNTVVLQVHVATAGTYTLTTNSTNGIQFSGTGSFADTGMHVITLTGTGTPLAAGTFSYTPGTSGCSFAIVSASPGVSGGTASYSFAGAPGNCTAAVVGGTYATGTAVNAADTVVLSVNVTSVGTYTVATGTVNGVSFAGAGTFTVTGPQTIKLAATGTPVAGGSFSYTPGSAGCGFSINVTGAVALAGCKDCNYYPTCPTSRYTYNDTINGTSNTVTSTQLSSTDTVIGGVTYQKLVYSSTPATQGVNNVGYVNCSNGVTTQKSYSGTTFNGNSVQEITLRILQANLPVGGTWTDSIAVPGGAGQYNIYDFTMEEKGISRVVLGTTYNNVIHISLVSGIDISGTYIESSVTDYYYAQNVGLIEAITTNSLTGAVALHQVLVSYFIP